MIISQKRTDTITVPTTSAACAVLRITQTVLKKLYRGSEWLVWIFAFYYQVLIHGFTQSLLLDDAGSVLATATSWDELEIQEEAESGSSVTSKIQLPAQVSRSHPSRHHGLKKGI